MTTPPGTENLSPSLSCRDDSDESSSINVASFAHEADDNSMDDEVEVNRRQNPTYDNNENDNNSVDSPSDQQRTRELNDRFNSHRLSFILPCKDSEEEDVSSFHFSYSLPLPSSSANGAAYEMKYIVNDENESYPNNIDGHNHSVYNHGKNNLRNETDIQPPVNEMRRKRMSRCFGQQQKQQLEQEQTAIARRKRLYSIEWEKKKKKRSFCMKILYPLRFLWSIFGLFVLCSVLVALFVGGGVWIVNFYTTRKAVDEIVSFNRYFLLRRIRGCVRDAMALGPRNLNVMAKELIFSDRFGLNISDPEVHWSKERQTALLYSFLKNSPFSIVSMADEQNNYIGVYTTQIRSQYYDFSNPWNGGTFETNFTQSISDGDGTLSFFEFNSSIAGPGKMMSQIQDYYPTKRQWYIDAKENSPRITWSEVYLTKTDPTFLAITGAMTYHQYDNSSNILGVASVTLSLDGLSSTIVITENATRIYVIDASYFLIASSSGSVTGNGTMLKATNHSDSIIKETSRHISQKFGSKLDMKGSDQFLFRDSVDHVWIVAMSRFDPDSNLNWFMITVSLRSEIRESVNKAQRIALIVSLPAMSGIIILSVIMGLIVTRPLLVISQKLRKVTNMKFNNLKLHSFSCGLYEIEFMWKDMRRMFHSLVNFESYVPADIVRALVIQKKIAKLGVKDRDISVIFIRISHFSEICNLNSPENIVKILQILLDDLTDAISSEQGMIDKFMGDTVMALFNAPITVPQHAVKAVRAAVKIQNSLIAMNRKWIALGYPQLRLNIGVNTSECLVGNIGCQNRVSYTAVGDGVNVASRLTYANERYDTSVLIGPLTRELVKDYILCRWISRVCLKGKKQPLDIYEPVCMVNESSLEQRAICKLQNQVKLYIEGGLLTEAMESLHRLLNLKPEDKSALEMLKRLQQPNFENVISLWEK